MRVRLLLLFLIVLAAASAAAVRSKHQRASASPDDDRREAVTSPVAAPTPTDMGPHMRMTSVRPPQAGDERRAAAVAAGARQAIEKYQDYSAALRDGYQILLPQVPQKMYHFNHPGYYAEAERHFNVEHPTSLLYEKTSGGYRLIGVMYTAPAGLTEDELDARIPLSVAAWHQHVNVCLPAGGRPLTESFRERDPVRAGRFDLNRRGV
jgi:hypothetical protein